MEARNLRIKLERQWARWLVWEEAGLVDGLPGGTVRAEIERQVREVQRGQSTRRIAYPVGRP